MSSARFSSASTLRSYNTDSGSPSFTPASFSSRSRTGAGTGMTSATTTTTRPRTGRPRTATTRTSGPFQQQEVICAVSESRGISPTVGLAFLNISTSEAVLCQICDSQTYARTIQKLTVYDPTEILFMNTVTAGPASKSRKLWAIVEENLPRIMTTSVERRYWAEATGYAYVEQLAFKEDVESIKMSLEGNYFATCSLAAALKYVEVELSKTFAFHSLRIKYEPSEGSMMIDLSTIISLELIQNLQSAKSKHCLFGILNETLTPMGSRLLRSNMLQPSTDEAKLMARYDAVAELSTKEELFHAVRKALRGLVDADKVLTSLILIPTKVTFQHAEQSINNIIMLKTYVSAIKPVFEALMTAQSDLLQVIRDLCAPIRYETISKLISSTINEDVTYQSKPLDLRNQRTYAIKAGVNSLLDVARQTYKEANNDVVDLTAKLKEEYDIDIDLRFETGRQYYFRIPATYIESESLPDIFVNVFRRKKFLEFQTLDLVKLNQKITDSHNEVVSMSDRSTQELLDSIRSEISGLFRVSEGVAMLDMLASFAQLGTVQDYVRPEITDTLAIKAGRHPIQEIIHASKYVPNDAYATQQSRFQIITGCNMSGKSTYIRSLALMSIMAQIGCFVPAQYASFPVIESLFTRISADDNAEANVSTFSAEMREMSFILRNMTASRSMIIIDELGRGTSTVDGLAIAIAIAEALIESHALVWFTTHFHDLARFLAERAGVVNLHLAVEASAQGAQMRMLYKIVDGCVKDTHYGIEIAKLLPLPERMLDIAAHVSNTITLRSEKRKKSHKVLAQSKRRKLVLALREQLLQAREGAMDAQALLQWLSRLKAEFATRLAQIEGEAMESEDEESLDEEIGGSDTDGPRDDVDDYDQRINLSVEEQDRRFPEQVHIKVEDSMDTTTPENASDTSMSDPDNVDYDGELISD